MSQSEPGVGGEEPAIEEYRGTNSATFGAIIGGLSTVNIVIVLFQAQASNAALFGGMVTVSRPVGGILFSPCGPW